MAFAYLDRLNQKQKEAVVSKARHLQILAGPGSGKTRGKASCLLGDKMDSTSDTLLFTNSLNHSRSSPNQAS